ncbi:MAG: hypothetical protein ACXVPC_07900 [Tumebacillaceae bacterium]
MDFWNQDISLSAATSNNQDAFERESSAHAAAPLLTGPMGPGPMITGPMVTGPVPMPFQVPLTPGTYPAYYQVPMTYPYPVRSFDAHGDESEWEHARFFPGPFYPRPYFYPRPFFYPPVPLPPPFFPPFFI